jgi:hypothetical protein
MMLRISLEGIHMVLVFCDITVDGTRVVEFKLVGVRSGELGLVEIPSG